MKYTRTVLYLICLLLSNSIAFAGLSEKQSGSYRIILNTDASGSEKWAARELQQWLFKISGEM